MAIARYSLGRLLRQIDYLEGEIEELSGRIAVKLAELLPPEAFARLDGIPGVNRRTIENVVAEIGPDISAFPDAHPLVSWAGLCPGNEESAGRRLRSRTRKGNRWLRRALSEAAWAASQKKDSYSYSQFRRLVRRRGKKRALVAVAHSLLVVMYYVLREEVEYKDLGADYFDRLEPERLRRYLVRRLQGLGYEVSLSPNELDTAAA